MKRLVLGLLVALVALAAAPAPAPAATTTTPYIVTLRDTVDVDATISDVSARFNVIVKLRYKTALRGFSAGLSSSQVSALRADSRVAFLEQDRTFTATGLTALSAGETVPPGIRRIAAATTTQAHFPANSAVAVLDTGIDLANADLNAVSGTNCITPGTVAKDDNGHGTHVAGVIAARNSGATVTGVAPGTKVYAVKVLNSKKTGTLSQTICGIDWVAANAGALGIKVINMSLGASGTNDNNCGISNGDSEHKAICNLVNTKGVTVVASAGNNGRAITNYIPAVYPEVLTVSAMTDTEGRSGGLGAAPSCKTGEKDDSYGIYSNYAGNASEQSHMVAAPGTCIVSDKIGGGTATYVGTSQAAPHVAGTVALCLGNGGVPGPCAGLTPSQIVAKIRSDAQAAATLTDGFAGDPFRPLTGKYFGYLATAAGY